MLSKLKNKLLVLTVALVAAAPAMAQVTVDPEISGGIADGVGLILGIVALGGAGFIAIASAGTGWNVGAKFIKRLGGKA